MARSLLFLFVLIVVVAHVQGSTPTVSDVRPFKISVCNKGCNRERRDAEHDVAEKIRSLMDHYKQVDPLGLPGAPIPDPFQVPGMRKSFALTTMNFDNITVHGQSKFRIQHIRADLAKLQVTLGVQVDNMSIAGSYTMSSWLKSSAGTFTVNLTNVAVDGIASLEVDRSGKLRAQDLDMDIGFETIKLKFQNLGGMAYLFQGIINSVGTFLFDSIKPFILKEVNTGLRRDINENMDKIPQRFPNSIPPLDMAIAEVRNIVREKGYDPLQIPDHNTEMSVVNVSMNHMWVTGLATFYRLGEVSLGVMNNTANATVMLGTQRISGRCHWEVSVLGLASRTGTAKFWADYLQARVSVLQPLNVQRRPRIESLTLKLGNIQTRVDGSGTLDYVVEFALNVLPNVLRYQIISLAEEPLRQRVQEQLSNVDVEAYVMQMLEILENTPGEEKGETDEREVQPDLMPNYDYGDYEDLAFSSRNRNIEL